MNNKIINSTQNLKIKEFAKLRLKKYRDKKGMFIVENEKVIQQIQNKKLIIELFTTRLEGKGVLINNVVMKKLSSQKTIPETLAIVKKTKQKFIGKRVLVLDNLQDPKNVGTLIRSAKSFNFTDVIVKGADIYSPKVLHASKGSFFQVNVLQVNDLSKYLKQTNVIGTLFKDKKAISYQKLKINKEENFALLLGNEGHGISLELKKFINVNVCIPINFESLNVAIAGSILMNELQKENW